MNWGGLPCRRVEIICTDTKITWWSYRCTNQLVHRASANSVVETYVKHRDEEKQEECLPKETSFAGMLFNYLNRQGWVQSDFSGTEHNTHQIWSCRVVWFLQSVWIWAVVPGKTTQLTAHSWTTSSSSEEGRKNDLVCSLVQRDAESSLLGPVSTLSLGSRVTYSIHLVPLLHGIRVWFGVFADFYFDCATGEKYQCILQPHIFSSSGVGRKTGHNCPLHENLASYLPLMAILDPES